MHVIHRDSNPPQKSGFFIILGWMTILQKKKTCLDRGTHILEYIIYISIEHVRF